MGGHAQAVTLASNVDATGDGSWTFWPGGRAVLVVQATSYSTALNFQMMGPDGNAITLNSSTINADGSTAYDLPAGSYRYSSSGGTLTDLYMVIARVPY